jgi:hypothetical protein
MSDKAALPQFELPRSDDQNHTEQCKAKHHESNPENTQTAAHASSRPGGGRPLGTRRCCRTRGARPDLAGRNWPNKTSQPRSSAPPASQTDYIAIAPGIGVFDPLRHYGRFTRPPGEVAGPPIGVHGYSAQAAPMLVRALHRQTIPLMPRLLLGAQRLRRFTQRRLPRNVPGAKCTIQLR